MVRQEDILLAKGANGGKSSDGFGEPSEDRGSGDCVQPFELTRGVKVIPATPGSARLNPADLSYIRHDATVEPSQGWDDDEENGEDDTDNHNNPNASR